MKSIVLLTGFLLYATVSVTQEQTYDLISYTIPSGWKKETGNSYVSYSHINNRKKTWCQITIFKSNTSKGDVDTDFNDEWSELVDKTSIIVSGPAKEPPTDINGWKHTVASAGAKFNNADIMILFSTYTDLRSCISIIAKTNDADYLRAIETFDKSIVITRQPSSGHTQLADKADHSSPSSSTALSKFKFASTEWDDGWVTFAEDEWAEVKKGNISVLIHYPNKTADAYHSVLKDGLLNAWKILVSPRYSDIRNVELKPIQSFESIAFCEADAIETKSGRAVHIVLFKKHYSNGNGRYLEFVTTNKQTYEQEFGPYHNDEFGWDKTAGMQFRNKFAVGPGDLNGKWAANDYASLSYYYTSNGGFAGATATSIAHVFTFLPDGSYESDHSGASGNVGNQRFARQVYKGKTTVKNWNIELSNRFGGKPEMFDCYFEAIRGGRILLLTDKYQTTYSLVRSR